MTHFDKAIKTNKQYGSAVSLVHAIDHIDIAMSTASTELVPNLKRIRARLYDLVQIQGMREREARLEANDVNV